MKSSRSASTQNTRRNNRRIISELSDDDSCLDSSNGFNHTDSDQAEKLFSRFRLQKSTSDLDNMKDESIDLEAERTLFRLSDTSDSESSLRTSNIIKKKSSDKKKSSVLNDESTSKDSINKPFKNDLLKYRNVLESSEDEESKSSFNNTFNSTRDSEKNSSSIHSGEDGVLEELTDNSISSSENCITNESFFVIPKKLKQRKILESSDDCEVEETTTEHSIVHKTNNILESESDDDIVNSSNEIFPTPLKVNNEKCEIDMKLKDLSIIESSDSDNIMSAHYKSTIASSNENRLFVDDLNFLQGRISHSSILENSNFKELNDPKRGKNIETITLDNDSPTSEVFSSKYNQPVIDLTEDVYENKSSKSSITSLLPTSIKKEEQLTISDFKSLKMEKERLEEVLKRFTTNIDNMKNTMKVTNLHLLPDGGLKLSRAISKEENAFKDTLMQLKNVDQRLKKFPGSFCNQEEPTKNILPSSFNPPSIPLNSKALIKKAAADIDIGAMGQKALSTYRAQQAMTLDVLHNLHKSLDTCPDPSVLPSDPLGLNVQLMPHQKYALAWLTWREKQKPHGGILADDMGLGKTLTMISLILKSSTSEKNRDYSDSDSDMDESLADSKFNNIRGGSLIICPSSLISQWQNEVKNKIRPRILDVVQHYGPNRESSARRLAKKDIVITTYHVVMWDLKSHKNTSPLFQIKWRRIILDEAHTIRNYKSQTSIAVSELHGVNRWALSGTPIHNKEADFYALLKFIKCHPFDDWAVWKRWVGNNDEAGKNRLSLLVKALMLRRTKTELSEATSFKLPLKTVQNIKIELFKEEKEAYEKVLHFSSKLFATYLYEKAEKENAFNRGFPVHNKVKYLHQTNMEDNIFKDHPELDKLFKQLKNNKNIQAHHILVLLLRLRQLCCHPCLMKNMLENESLKVDGIQDTKDLDLVDTMSRMSIGVPSVETQTLSNSNPIFYDSWVSSKIKAVCDMVKEKVLYTEDKAIIVSQWPSMLNLIAKQLSQYNIKTELFSGAVPILHRNKIVNEFNNLAGGIKILLLSLTAGGVGLNLVAANHLFMVDIHWNPQLEAQACDRIYRVGQKKPVYVYKFICDNTIETSIQSIQHNKLEIANNLFGGCHNVEGTKITLDDLKQIFNINPNKKG